MLRLKDIPEDKFIAYDLETTGVHAPYCELKMIGYQIGLKGTPQLVDLTNKAERKQMAAWLRDPNMLKVSYNGINYDDLVLFRYGFYVEPRGRHDMFFALKTILPSLPRFGLKLVNALFFGDWHEPERKMHAWLKHNKVKEMWKAPPDLLGPYCMHDVTQTVRIFSLIWERVQDPSHWKVYKEMELALAAPLHEMVLLAGEYIDIDQCRRLIAEREAERERISTYLAKLTGNKVLNAASNPQVTRYMREIEGMELEMSTKGNYSVRKSDLIEWIPNSKVAKAIFEYRDLSKVIEHLTAHLEAAIHEQRKTLTPVNNGSDGLRAIDCYKSIAAAAASEQPYGKGLEAIPKGYTGSSASTRRFRSSSFFGINFQNQNKRTKIVELVPPGWLGLWVDSRQIENVVHIFKSEDQVRRAAYEADPDWNEYVWLSNEVQGTNYSRKELESIPAPTDPNVSVYKAYKQIKLALNFGMGVNKFAKRTGLTVKVAAKEFDRVHKACPAIRHLGEVLRKEAIENGGFVRDPFGHIYAGSARDINKLISTYIQGCGTGSVAKAMTIANYATLHSLDTNDKPIYTPYMRHPYTGVYSYGMVCGTTHDECAMRISLGLPAIMIVRLIREVMYNMEERFSPLFGGIPLRAQLAVSYSNAAEQIELNHNHKDFEQRLRSEFIVPAKAKFRLGNRG